MGPSRALEMPFVALYLCLFPAFWTENLSQTPYVLRKGSFGDFLTQYKTCRWHPVIFFIQSTLVLLISNFQHLWEKVP